MRKKSRVYYIVEVVDVHEPDHSYGWIVKDDYYTAPTWLVREQKALAWRFRSEHHAKLAINGRHFHHYVPRGTARIFKIELKETLIHPVSVLEKIADAVD